MSNVVIIHGWDADPYYGDFQLIKKELERKNVSVSIPMMPNPKYPVVSEWIDAISKENINENTVLVGHSLGVQAILRYLSKYKVKIKGIISLAGFFILNDYTYNNDDDKKLIAPWLEDNLDYEAINSSINNFIAIFSDNDPYVPIDNVELFKKRFDVEIIIEHNKEHFGAKNKNVLDGFYSNILKLC